MELKIDANLTEQGKEIAERLLDTRRRELELIADLTEEQLIGPAAQIVEPPIWELGHVGWFQDRWILQRDLVFPSRGQTVEYITDILERIILRLTGRDPTREEIYFYKLVLNHEEMHSETMHHIRQTFGYPAPKLSLETWEPEVDPDFELHEIEIPGGVYCLGGTEGQPFIFDNEKWAHPVEIKPFRISAAPVTFGQYQQFVDEGGYLERALWSDEGWAWRERSGQEHPVYWKKGQDSEWLWRWYQVWMPIEPYLPMVNVNWYEANAYSKWAGRRLPSEAEWELAASASLTSDGKGFTEEKRWYPWGNQHPERQHANLNSATGGLADVRAYPEGDSAFGLWEWTADTFDAFPGYVIDPYDTYSEPSFGQQKVLRGGCWATRPHVIRNTFRNFYTPDRNNIFAGFRTAS